MVHYSDSSGDERESVKEKRSQALPQTQELKAKIRFKYRGTITIHY